MTTEIFNDKQFCKMRHVMLKIFNSPILYTLALWLVVLVISFGFGHPVYQTCDDLTMRSIIDGSYGYPNEPHAFVLWQHIYYTTFLQHLYLIFPQVPWYDLFTYIFMSISLITVSLCLYSKRENKNIFNLFLFLILLFLYSMMFISPQFSITSGCLALAGFILYYYIFTNKLSILKNVIYTVLMSLLFIQASLIRFEILCVMLPLAIFVSLLLLKRESVKKYICISLFLFLTVAFTYFLQIRCANIIDSNPNYKLMRDTHIARLDISERTTIYNNADVYTKLWSNLTSINDLDKKLKPVNWTKGAYMISLTWLDVGDSDIFNIEKMKKVKELLNDELTLQNHLKISFKVADYHNVLKYYFLIILFLIAVIPSKKGNNKVLLSVMAYFLFILLSNNLFKTFPPRIWMNLMNLIILSSFLMLKTSYNNFNLANIISKYIKENNYTSQFNTLNFDKVIIVLIVLLFFAFGITPLKKVITKNAKMYDAYTGSLQFLNYLSDEKIYIIDEGIVELYSHPFSKNIFRLKKIIPTLPFAPETKEILSKYKIPSDSDTIKTLCERKDIYYYTRLKQPYYNFWADNTKTAISMFMKDIYGKEIAFVPIQKSKNMAIYDIVELSEDEIVLKNKIKNIVSNLSLYDLISDKK